jgi:hypothetical protein
VASAVAMLVSTGREWVLMGFTLCENLSRNGTLQVAADSSPVAFGLQRRSQSPSLPVGVCGHRRGAVF